MTSISSSINLLFEWSLFLITGFHLTQVLLPYNEIATLQEFLDAFDNVAANTDNVCHPINSQSVLDYTFGRTS